MISSGVSILYSFFTNAKKLKERMPDIKEATGHVTEISKAEFKPTQKYITLEICCGTSRRGRRGAATSTKFRRCSPGAARGAAGRRAPPVPYREMRTMQSVCDPFRRRERGRYRDARRALPHRSRTTRSCSSRLLRRRPAPWRSGPTKHATAAVHATSSSRGRGWCIGGRSTCRPSRPPGLRTAIRSDRRQWAARPRRQRPFGGRSRDCSRSASSSSNDAWPQRREQVARAPARGGERRRQRQAVRRRRPTGGRPVAIFCEHQRSTPRASTGTSSRRTRASCSSDHRSRQWRPARTAPCVGPPRSSPSTRT